MECALALTVSSLALITSLITLVRESRVKLRKEGRRKEIKRYILFVALCEGEIKREVLERTLIESFVSEFGRFYLASSGFKLVYFDEKVCMGVIRVNYEFKPHVLVLLSKIREVDGKSVTLIPLRTFGTLKSAIDRIPKLPGNTVEG